MKESIIIKNLGPLKEVEIRYIKPLTVFIDKSAIGKSTIMKIIVLMRYIYKMVNIRFYLKNAKITRPPFKLRFNSLLQDGLESMITAETEISCPMPTKLSVRHQQAQQRSGILQGIVCIKNTTRNHYRLSGNHRKYSPISGLMIY